MSGLSVSRRAIGRLFVAVLLLTPALGCGGSGHRVSGKVTFKGQPVPAGKIYFIPDGSKGNSGPTGYADIKNGAYDTAAPGGAGMIGGPIVVAIEGVDPNSPPDKKEASEDVTVKTLFPRYEVPVDMPKADTTKDFEVPAEAIQVKPRKDLPIQP